MFKWLNLQLGKKPGEAKKKLKEAKQKTRRLWEREFSVAKNGLDEQQVISFVNDLITQHKTSQAASSASLRSLLKTAATDAEQIAASIKMKAQTEAEAEAAMIITRARQEHQEIRRKAELAAQKEVEDIISVANRKAQLTEVEAKQNALLFLLKAREEVEKEVRQEYKRVYSQLSSSLQNLMSEGQNIEIELKSKRARLWESKPFELKEDEAVLLRTPEPAAPPSETSVSTQIEIEPDIAIKEKTEEPTQLQKEPTGEEIEQSAEIREEISGEKIEQPIEFQEQAVVSEPVELATEELLEQPLQEERSGRGKAYSATLEEGSETLYAGEVELAITMPVDLKMVSKLYDYLQTIRELKILRTRGSWDRGTTITVVLEKPIPLISLISKMPDIEVTPELPEKETPSSLLRKRGREVKRIKLALKRAQPP